MAKGLMETAKHCQTYFYPLIFSPRDLFQRVFRPVQEKTHLLSKTKKLFNDQGISACFDFETPFSHDFASLILEHEAIVLYKNMELPANLQLSEQTIQLQPPFFD